MFKTNGKKTLSRVGVLALALIMTATAMGGSVFGAAKTTRGGTFNGAVDGVATVATAADFAKAAADSTVSKIVLAANITFDEFQAFDRTVLSNLVIDGSKGLSGAEGKPYMLNVTRSDSWVSEGEPSGHVSLEFKKFKSVTFQNIRLKGEAFNGFVYSNLATDFLFDNVCFDGPALAMVRSAEAKGYARVTIKDSKLNLRTRNSGANYLYPSEAVEIGHGDVILEGEVTIVKEPGEKDDLDHDEIFYFKKETGNLIVAPNAKVEIKNLSRAATSDYWSGLIYRVGSNCNINFIVKEGADFYFHTDGGVLTEHGIKTLSVAEGANVKLSVNAKYKASLTSVDSQGSYLRADEIIVAPAARLDVIATNKGVSPNNKAKYEKEAVVGVNLLKVGKDATFRVASPDNTVRQVALRIHGNANPAIQLDRPEEVLLYNGNKTAPAMALKAGDRNGGNAQNFGIEFVGAGISAWSSAGKVAIDENTWEVDPAGASVWSTGLRDKTFTFKTTIDKGNGNLTNSSVTAENGVTLSDVSPADGVNGLKTLNDKSVILFNGFTAPKTLETKQVRLNLISKYILDKWHNVPEDLWIKDFVDFEANGVDPIVYNFKTYGQNGRGNDYGPHPAHPELGVFKSNLYDRPQNERFPGRASLGTVEGIKALADKCGGSYSITGFGNDFTLVLWPNAQGVYPGEDGSQLVMYYALMTEKPYKYGARYPVYMTEEETAPTKNVRLNIVSKYILNTWDEVPEDLWIKDFVDFEANGVDPIVYNFKAYGQNGRVENHVEHPKNSELGLFKSNIHDRPKSEWAPGRDSVGTADSIRALATQCGGSYSIRGEGDAFTLTLWPNDQGMYPGEDGSPLVMYYALMTAQPYKYGLRYPVYTTVSEK
ncbi:MAG: hypothetical protein LBG71_05105 [Clostridiales Family XIII bacterium]|jgi:hypothetical protein|nr:hypothetical protein [Clostridiales Family XIII bacterium]